EAKQARSISISDSSKCGSVMFIRSLRNCRASAAGTYVSGPAPSLDIVLRLGGGGCRDVDGTFLEPSSDLVGCVPVGVSRMIPIEIHNGGIFLAEGVVPPAFEYVVVDEVLHLVAPSRNTEPVEVFLDLDLLAHPLQCMPKQRELSADGKCLARSHRFD